MAYKDPDKRRAYHREYQRRWSKTPNGIRVAARWQANQAGRRCGVLVSQSEIEAVKARSNGLCESCGEGCRQYAGLCVDHCHSTGTIRGMLCSKCNVAAGMLNDDPNRARRLACYLERSRDVAHV